MKSSKQLKLQQLVNKWRESQIYHDRTADNLERIEEPFAADNHRDKAKIFYDCALELQEILNETGI